MEAVGIALCGKHFYNGNQTLLVQDFYPVPYDVCERTEDYIRWSTDFINPLLEKAQKENLSLLKIHCHPSGYDSFSDLDNESDYVLFVSIHSWLQSNYPHSSCVMLPDGKLFGRFFHENMEEEIVHQFSIIGSDIKSWHYSDNELSIKSEAFKRNEQAFGKKTVKLLSKMKIAVVGCSGTGSPTIEQLTRLGVSTLVLVDNHYLNTGLYISKYGFDAYNETMVGLNFYKQLSKLICLGVRMNYSGIHYSDDEPDVAAFTGDIGVLIRPADILNISLLIVNPLRTELKMGEEIAQLPNILTMGVSFQPEELFLLTAEIEKDFALPAIYKFGIEYEPIKELSVRAGMWTKPFTPSFGVGLNLQPFTLNMAFSKHPVLGFNSCCGLQFNF
jgi:hypothetical protein